MTIRCGRSPTKVLNGQLIGRSFGPGPKIHILADLESNLDDLFQIECDAANAMMKIRFGPTPTRFCTQKGASCDPKKVG